ncbi:MAG TPA: hypothetical protein VKZ74_03465 [Natronosporangium sp.]|nr:hypothetical protein [Natronosporangium sp.]
MVAVTHPLVAEAVRKAAVAWVAVDDRPARAVWCMPVDGALWVVTGPGEQDAPGLAEARQARVTLRGDHGGQVVTYPATVTRVAPGSQEWNDVVPLLAGKRLNAPVDAATLVERWAAECAVLTLTPAGDPVAAGPTLPDGPLAAPPRTRGHPR